MFIYSSVRSDSPLGLVCEFEHVPFEINGMNIYASSISECISHWHSAPEFIAVVSGVYTFRIAGDELTVPAGKAIYIPPNEIHSLVSLQEGGQVLTVQVSPELYKQADIFQGLCLGNSRVRPGCHAVLFRDVLGLAECRLVSEGRRGYLELSAFYTLLDTLQHLEREELMEPGFDRQFGQELIRECIQFVSSNFMAALSLSDVAEKFGVNYHGLSRTFKRVCGYGFKEYLTLVRLEHAKRLLGQPSLPITDVSQRAGFSEHKYLVLAFKKYMNVTPTEYRRRARERMGDQAVSMASCLVPLRAELIESWKLLL